VRYGTLVPPGGHELDATEPRGPFSTQRTALHSCDFTDVVIKHVVGMPDHPVPHTVPDRLRRGQWPRECRNLANFFERTVSAYQVGISGDVAFEEDF
jgi:hypothetical protein